jgi:dimethylamine monooxygenase subunit A
VNPLEFSKLFEASDYRFQMGLRQGELSGLLAPSRHRAKILAERADWLAEDPQRYSALYPEGNPVLAEVIETAQHDGHLAGTDLDSVLRNQTPLERCRALGRVWEPDFLLLASGLDGTFRLQGGCLCFPTAWDLSEKMGEPLWKIHGPVPTLNAQLGSKIDLALSRIQPGAVWTRQNWGLSRVPDLNYHPARQLQRLDARVTADEVWFRVEHQALLKMPRSGGLLFLIRVTVHPLADLQAERGAANGLRNALRTMPEVIAQYKGLANARQRIIALLEATEPED